MSNFDWGPVWGPLAGVVAAVLAFLGGMRTSRANASTTKASAHKSDSDSIKALVESAVALVGVTRSEYEAAQGAAVRQLAEMQLKYDAKILVLTGKVAVLERANAWYRAFNQRLIVQLHEAGLVPVWMDSPEPEHRASDE